MKITLLAEDRLRLEGAAAPMTVEAESPEMAYSPFHMVASGLGLCIFSVLHSWASHASLDAGRLTIEVSWRFADAPKRIGNYDVHITWPGLPEQRRTAALRAAALCPVHKTLLHPPTMAMEIVA